MPSVQGSVPALRTLPCAAGDGTTGTGAADDHHHSDSRRLWVWDARPRTWAGAWHQGTGSAARPPTDKPEKSRVAGLAPPCAAGRWEGRAGPQGHSVPLQHESLLGSGPRQPREASGRGSLRLAALVSNHSLVFLAGFCSFKNLNLRCWGGW